jgi:hypothetical protein
VGPAINIVVVEVDSMKEVDTGDQNTMVSPRPRMMTALMTKALGHLDRKILREVAITTLHIKEKTTGMRISPRRSSSSEGL